uniref:Uncharacterized protein n=1 Tax=Panagrolaimus sp. JU765 TaxID=591449 RepID=A0AC34PV23_9BILA
MNSSAAPIRLCPAKFGSLCFRGHAKLDTCYCYRVQQELQKFKKEASISIKKEFRDLTSRQVHPGNAICFAVNHFLQD